MTLRRLELTRIEKAAGDIVQRLRRLILSCAALSLDSLVHPWSDEKRRPETHQPLTGTRYTVIYARSLRLIQDGESARSLSQRLLHSGHTSALYCQGTNLWSCFQCGNSVAENTDFATIACLELCHEVTSMPAPRAATANARRAFSAGFLPALTSEHA